MKKIIYLLSGVIVLASCGNNKAEETVPPSVNAEASEQTTTPEKHKFSTPIKYTEWEIGKPENIEMVLSIYELWDAKQTDQLAQYFSDTLKMKIPSEREEFDIPNANINAVFAENLKQYQRTENRIISAVSLHDRERNEDWVKISAFTKWTEDSGKRDSLLYADDWRFKDGKIDKLYSYQRVPVKKNK